MKTILEIEWNTDNFALSPDYLADVLNKYWEPIQKINFTVRELPAQEQVNARYLLDAIRIYSALCPSKSGTWQMRAEQAVEAAEKLSAQAPIFKEKLNQFADFIKRFANWSERWPRKIIYNTSNIKMDDELIGLEEEAHKIIRNWQPIPAKVDDGIAIAVPAKTAALMADVDDKNLCEWKLDTDGFWHSACAMAFECPRGTPTENNFMYCPFCGRKLSCHAQGEG